MGKFSFDNLKKMGSDLVNSAKNLNVGGMVDSIKSQVENFSGGKSMCDKIQKNLNELMTLYPNLAEELKKVQADFSITQGKIEAIEAEKAAALKAERERIEAEKAAARAKAAEEAQAAAAAKAAADKAAAEAKAAQTPPSNPEEKK